MRSGIRERSAPRSVALPLKPPLPFFLISLFLFHSFNNSFLAFPPLQHPIAAQLGGSNPATLAAAAAIVATYGYDEVNLNCGCPSDRVAGAGCFGAALMKDPARVAAATAAMRAASGLEVTVKCRLGVDGVDSYAALAAFVRTVSEGGGVTHFLIHARACLLAGLSPAQNRAVPPLRPGWVLALARDFPHLRFTLNGGLAGSHAIVAALDTPRERQQQNVVGGMVGRAAYHTPWHALADADAGLYGAPTNPATSRRAVLAAYAAYADGARAAAAAKEAAALAAADPPTARPRAPPSIRTLVAPLLGLFHGAPRARAWRNAVDTALRLDPASVAAVLEVRGRRGREKRKGRGSVPQPLFPSTFLTLFFTLNPHTTQQTLPILRDEDLDAPPEAMRPLGAGEAEASRRDATPCPPVEWGDVPADPQSMDRAGLPAFWVDRPAKEGKKAKRKQLAEGGLVGCGEVEAAVP